MRKQYIFLLLLFIILYLIYLIISFTYREYKTTSDIEFIKEIITDIENSNKKASEIIRYKSSKAYVNLVLKEQQSFKNKAEEVIFLTTEDKFNKFTKEIKEEKKEEDYILKKSDITESMTIFEKWIYFLFKKDIR